MNEEDPILRAQYNALQTFTSNPPNPNFPVTTEGKKRKRSGFGDGGNMKNVRGDKGQYPIRGGTFELDDLPPLQLEGLPEQDLGEGMEDDDEFRANLEFETADIDFNQPRPPPVQFIPNAQPPSFSSEQPTFSAQPSTKKKNRFVDPLGPPAFDLGSSSFEINNSPLQRQPQQQTQNQMEQQALGPLNLDYLREFWPEGRQGGGRGGPAYLTYGQNDERWKAQGLDKKGRMIGYKQFEKVNPNMQWGQEYPLGPCPPAWAVMRKRGKANYARTIATKYGGNPNATPLAQIMAKARPEYANIKQRYAAAGQKPPQGTWGAVLKRYGSLYKESQARVA